ncbi:unnamed protein product [Pieris brassicae]|uniref:Uncharacterized protein n=1 Tax=Pieris brassicae TaxID=7116 RepID=A0A9P0TRB3_PIEBR|nr:unnamed protein product [Pieris brassicae]
MAIGHSENHLESESIQYLPVINSEQIQDCNIPARVYQDITTGKDYFDTKCHPISQPNPNDLTLINVENEDILPSGTEEKQTLFDDITQEPQIAAQFRQQRETANFSFDTDSYPDSQRDYDISLTTVTRTVLRYLV